MKKPSIKKNKCVFCNKTIETRDHIFLECDVTKNMFEKIKCKFEQNITCRVRGQVYYNVGIEHEDVKTMTIYKMSIWRLKYIISDQTIKNFDKSFIDIFRNLYRKHK